MVGPKRVVSERDIGGERRQEAKFPGRGRGGNWEKLQNISEHII